jgi:hypothetical protein
MDEQSDQTEVAAALRTWASRAPGRTASADGRTFSACA